MYSDEKGSTKPPAPISPRKVASPRKTSGPQTLPPEDENTLESRDVCCKITEDEDRRMRSRHFDGQQPEILLSGKETETVKAEPVATDPATERFDDDKGSIGHAESVSFSSNPTAVLRGRGGSRSTSSTDATWVDWVLVDCPSNPATRPQLSALSEDQQTPTIVFQDVLHLCRTPSRVGASSLDGKSWSPNATRFAPANSLSGPPTQAYQTQHPSSSEHVGSEESPSGMDRSPGGRLSLSPVKHSQRLSWAQGEGGYDAQNKVANGSRFVEGQNLREASGECLDADHSEDSSWYHVSIEEVQYVAASSSPDPCRATNEMATQPETTREPQFTSFHLMGGVPPRQPMYSKKRHAEPDSRLGHTPLLLPAVTVEQSGYMIQGITKFNQQRDESRSLQAKAIMHDVKFKQ